MSQARQLIERLTQIYEQCVHEEGDQNLVPQAQDLIPVPVMNNPWGPLGVGQEEDATAAHESWMTERRKKQDDDDDDDDECEDDDDDEEDDDDDLPWKKKSKKDKE